MIIEPEEGSVRRNREDMMLVFPNKPKNYFIYKIGIAIYLINIIAPAPVRPTIPIFSNGRITQLMFFRNGVSSFFP